MSHDMVGRGGFYLPKIYKKAQQTVEDCLDRAEIDYAELTKWSFPDEFLCFVMEFGLLKFMDSTYPNPREKNEVPIWFLITCQFVLHLHQSGKYQHLRYLLNAGSILTRFGFNVGSPDIGFNDKNKKERKTAADADTVRKFFKDTNRDEIRDWYLSDLQKWFYAKKAFDRQGIFILDQSHLVVPDNPNYAEAVKMPVDIHGQYYSNFSKLTEEQKKALIYHRCYGLSTLLNVAVNQPTYHVAGYELGSGNEDELVQAERLIPAFCKRFPGVMKELIVDRGYINGEFIWKLKEDYGVDTLIPLKKNMDTHKDAIAIAVKKNDWVILENQTDHANKILFKAEAILVNDMDLWPTLKCKQQAIVTRYTEWDKQQERYDEHFSVFISTKKYPDPETAIGRYNLRVQIEERFRQFKNDWYIAEFPSPHASLIESHVCFTLLTYSLLQFYFRKKDWQDKTKRMITTLRMDERTGKDAVLVYSKDKYGVLGLDHYTIKVAGMPDTPRAKMIMIMEAQKEARLKRESEDNE